jgi:large subunit ribosomal protein L15
VAEPEGVPPTSPEDVRLDRLAPLPGSRRPRKRVGRGIGSGHGKTSGRGQKGMGSRSGGGVRAGYAGGQMPVYMQQGKLRGSNRKMSMPMGPFRTHTVAVNVGRLDVFEAGSVVDVDALVARGLVKNNANRDWPVKILAEGELDRALTVRAHAFSGAARAKIEAAGGTAEVIGEETAGDTGEG